MIWISALYPYAEQLCEKSRILVTFNIPSKFLQKYILEHICFLEQNPTKLHVWPHLLF